MAVGAAEANRRIDEALASGATSLDLSRLHLTEIPPRLRELPALTELNLRENYLRQLPEWLTDLPLTDLRLGENRLRHLPGWMARLTRLRRLRLDKNRLTELPRWLADLGLTDLYLDANSLAELPEWLGTMTDLTALDIAGCRLEFVPDWVANLTRLERLELDKNRLTELPNWLADLPNLTKLRLHSNRLRELPNWLADLALTELTASNNRLDVLPIWPGTVTTLTDLSIGNLGLNKMPDWVANLDQLTRLNLNNNLLTTLPDWFANLTKLTRFTIDDNHLATLPNLPASLTSLSIDGNRLATVPDQIGAMVNLTELGLGHCGLILTPGWMRNLTSLEKLRLHGNRLTALPEWLANLTRLESLWLNDNRLPELPRQLRELTSLRHLHVSGNLFQGLPEWLGDLTALTSLGIGNCHLTELPTWLGNLAGLTYLGLSDNKLRELPTEFTALPNLTALRLDGNPLTDLPAWICGLSDLIELGIDGCQLNELPDWISKLASLKYLLAAGNAFQSVDFDIGNLPALTLLDLSDCKLTELRLHFTKPPPLNSLYLPNNKLKSLPENIGHLANLTALWLSNNGITELPATFSELTSLEILQLNSNHIQKLPHNIDRLRNLTSLAVAENFLTTLPESIGKLGDLAKLNVSGNKLAGLPNGTSKLSRLTTLQVANNRLRTLPDCLVELPLLTDLTVAGNPLVSPPPEIVAGGAESMLEFLRERAQGSEAQWVSKLLVVGEGGAGKTSLVKALAEDPHDPVEPSTHGLMIRDLELDHPQQADVRMRLSAWDFGGQQIYHATHQFFLTNRSLFVLLWNARLGWQQGKLHYWLDIITARAPESPIVLVATHIEDRPVDLPLAELRAKYPNIVASVHVDNASRGGTEELRELLAQQAAELPLMGSEWPTTWLAAADAVRATADKHITPARMWEIMSEAGVEDAKRQSFIARALHELGDILYYAEDPELSEIVVLRPAWVNDYISRVLDSAEVADRHGLLTREHLNDLWRDLDKGIRDHFLGMMDKYDLSYRVDQSRAGDLSLVVERLQWNPPDYEQEWEEIRQRPDSREIKVVYQLNTTPPGIPTWFIARSHRFSRDTHWRTGALLGQRDGRHLALIKADQQRNVVELAVRGPSPVGFFMVLDDGLNLTLERFPGLNITRRVPCQCAEDCPEFFDYDNLQARLARTPPRHEIECHRSGELVSVPELLLGLAPSERDATRISIEGFAKTLEQFGDRFNEQSDYLQRMFLRLQRQAQQQQEARCPSVFAVVPADRRRITGSAYEIHLYCEEPGAWHRLPGALGVYPITQPREWFVKLGPHLQHLIWVLKHAAPLVGPVLGIAVDVLNQQAKADCDLMKELVGQLPKDVDYDAALPGDTPRDGGPAAHATTDADFRALRAMLGKLDPDESWGGLSRFDTPEGLTLYLCREHLAQYHR